MPIEITGRESISVPEGKHTGEIQKIEKRTSKEGYEYLDINLRFLIYRI